jgi:hypothetical protein
MLWGYATHFIPLSCDRKFLVDLVRSVASHRVECLRFYEGDQALSERNDRRSVALNQ